MPKKESYQKGMTKKEVYSKIDGLKTDKGKAQYLDKILSKKGLLAPETYKAVQESADEIYGKAAVEAVEEGEFSDAGEFAERIKDKKLASKVYEKAAVKAIEKGRFVDTREFINRIKDKKVADEMYGKAAVRAAERENFYRAREFEGRIKDKKVADEIRRRLEAKIKEKRKVNLKRK